MSCEMAVFCEFLIDLCFVLHVAGALAGALVGAIAGTLLASVDC